MKFYFILTFEEKKDGSTEIIYLKNMFLFKDSAFERCKEMGKNAVVIEATQTDSWIFDQIMLERS